MAEHSYHLKYPARALAVQVAEGHKSQWVVGTNARRDRNELHVLEYDADLDKLQAVRVLAHDNEIWDIATCPESVDRLITVHSKGTPLLLCGTVSLMALHTWLNAWLWVLHAWSLEVLPNLLLAAYAM